MMPTDARPTGLRRTRLLSLGAAVSLVVLGVLATHCGAGAKEQAIETGLDALSKEQRRSNFEDTAKVLDQHPEYVDELYSVARAHGPMLKRFLENASRDAKDEQLAKMAAEQLSNDPASLQQVLLAGVDASLPKPEARKAINRAAVMRVDAMSDILTDSSATLEAVIRAVLDVTAKKPKARDSLVAAVDKQSARLVAFAADNPKLMAAMTRPVLEAALKDKDSLLRLLKELKVL